MLINAGANVDQVDHDGRTALLRASDVAETARDILGSLLQAGADVNYQDHQGTTCLMRAALSHLSTVSEALIRDNNGATAIFCAVQENNHAVLELLLASGACHSRRTKNVTSLIHCAASCGDVDTMRILERAGLSGLRVDPLAIENYWCHFDERDECLQRAPLGVER
jgi:ankyrin repeat protein